MSSLRWFPPRLIDEAALLDAVRSLPRFGTLRYSVDTDSTQRRALEVLHRLDNLGISFVTESQDMGRGRAGRRWISPAASGLLFSTILPLELPNAALPAVGFWAALAIADSIANVCGVTLALKWPNDLLLDGKKCAGILSEGRTVGALTRIAVGVGVDVNRPQYVPDEIRATTAFLSDGVGEAVDRTTLLVEILRSYEARFDALVRAPQEIIRTWEQRSDLVGKTVEVKSTEGTPLRTGVVRGVSPQGALLLQTSEGEAAVTLGDVAVQ